MTTNEIIDKVNETYFTYPGFFYDPHRLLFFFFFTSSYDSRDDKRNWLIFTVWLLCYESINC